MMNVIIRIFILMSTACSVQAAESVEIQALFPGKVMLAIDGESKVLSEGQTHAGVKMISADGKTAVLEIDGEQKSYAPGTAISTSYTKPVLVREQVMADTRGMFLTHGSINGQSAHFLIDTGATSVAMSASDAKKLGVRYRLDGEPTHVTTASGVARAWHVKLRSVKLGRLEQKNIDAVVIEGNYPQHILLGMTFLERVKVTKEAGKMTLEQKLFSSAAE